ncbi:MAG: NAD(+)/NADH kinase [Nanoarchaeota archaeon]|nr:NAD(+)/NADH kinase [Nanoarchaeota archaeon]MBU1104074.1 NAD(+)/NADH kinase [Nanoarchaeota archaeon]
MFNKILLVHKENLSIEGERYLGILKEILKEKNLAVVKYDDVKREDVQGKDLVVAYGGDGTLVKTANLIDEGFILGINAEPKTSEGALTSLSREEIHELKKILNGSFDVVERQRAQVKLNGKLMDVFSLNEVYVGAALQFHSSRYLIKHNGKEEEQRSSGVIVSTGTSSNAWFKSAGGKPFHHAEKKLAFVVREPYVGKRVFCPKILEGEISENENLVIESKRDSGGLLAVDYLTCDFNKGDVVEISLAEKPLKVVTVKK